MKRMTNFWAFIKKLAGLIGFTGDKIEIGNDLEVDGKLKAFENITDVNDNPRFVDGQINTTQFTGATINFAKWSLSGTHLMIVVAGKSTTALTDNQTIAVMTLPKYIREKIKSITGGTTGNVTRANLPWFSDSGVADVGHDTYMSVDATNNTLSIINRTAFTPTTSSNFRFQFDLLIPID